MKRILFTMLFAGATAAAFANEPTVSALQWPEGKRAAFCLSFDDGCDSQVTNAFPLLKKYRVHGTFYVCPSWDNFKKREKDWGTDNPFVTLGNHTLTHGAFANPAELEQSIADCNAEIRRVGYDRRWPRIIAFGIPGTESITNLCKITEAEIAAMLDRQKIVVRLPYFGPPVVCTDIRGMGVYIDTVVAGGGIGHLDFHGVGGDWLKVDMVYFETMLQKLDANRDKLWFAPYADIYKYEKLRDESVLHLVTDAKGAMSVEMTTALDPALFDIPLWVKVKFADGKERQLAVRPGKNAL